MYNVDWSTKGLKEIEMTYTTRERISQSWTNLENEDISQFDKELYE